MKDVHDVGRKSWTDGKPKPLEDLWIYYASVRTAQEAIVDPGCFSLDAFPPATICSLAGIVEL